MSGFWIPGEGWSAPVSAYADEQARRRVAAGSPLPEPPGSPYFVAPTVAPPVLAEPIAVAPVVEELASEPPAVAVEGGECPGQLELLQCSRAEPIGCRRRSKASVAAWA
jgi:hypothetical protein